MTDPSSGTIRVVIVDDHEMLVESLVRLLGDADDIVVVDTASTGAAGIALARAVRPDVVLMDFQLPDMDGAAATRSLLEHVPEARVIMLTGSDRPGAYYAATQAGVLAWIRKTRAVHDLVDAVRRVHSGERVEAEEHSHLPALHEIVVHYQPVIDLNDGAIVGFEALARWAHPSRGLLGPHHFLPLAEETGFVAAIDAQVARVAAEQVARWAERFPQHPLWVSLNLSGSELNRPGVEDNLRTVIADAAIPPDRLVVEVTETVLLDDTDDTIVRLGRLKDIGTQLSLDDFGTAFSSLSYLHRFPFDHLKIDTSFTAELPDSRRTLLLVETIHHLAEAIGLHGIAEGIERPEQAEVLRGVGWELGQGYLYSRPISAAECDALIGGPPIDVIDLR